ncbi:hypothetical protein WN51_11119 [Melipona quadrifasciata]|uniref:Uncharacterized protein n=1 Tax=Melipona quadrifasciata TaxID=166423 RepID=A0A0N0BHV7_9HYME|nr:hypothetical protein WN51_11119 [Melipona quadrifasciata]
MKESTSDSILQKDSSYRTFTASNPPQSFVNFPREGVTGNPIDIPNFLQDESEDACTVCLFCGGYQWQLCPVCNGSKRSVHRNDFTAEFVALKCAKCDAKASNYVAPYRVINVCSYNN